MKSKDFYPISKKHSSELDKSIRLNKYISNAGLCSRREADTFIKLGLVQVNNNIITEMGYRVKHNDQVKYDGILVKQTPLVYIVLNKPKGFVATSQKRKINKSVQELIRSGVKTKVPALGDMGRSITGLLLFTNDERLRKKLNNSKGIHMVYRVLLDQNVTKDMMDKLKGGQKVFDKTQKVNIISHIQGKSKKEVGVEVHSINPSILVKLFSAVGVSVIQMDRVLLGGLTKKDLPRGNWRKLSTKEIGFLKMMS